MQAFNRYRARLSWAYDHPPIWDEGWKWYDIARERLARAVDGINLSVYRLAGVAAHLSPLTPWERNMEGAERLAELYGSRAPHGTLLGTAERSTVYNTHAERAVKYLTGNDFVKPSGPKTGPFQENLAGNFKPVTIDSHMCDVVDTFGLSSLTGNARRSMTRAVHMCATLYGIPPAKAQAIIWTVQRENLGPAR